MVYYIWYDFYRFKIYCKITSECHTNLHFCDFWPNFDHSGLHIYAAQHVCMVFQKKTLKVYNIVSCSLSKLCIFQAWYLHNSVKDKNPALLDQTFCRDSPLFFHRGTFPELDQKCGVLILNATRWICGVHIWYPTFWKVFLST